MIIKLYPDKSVIKKEYYKNNIPPKRYKIIRLAKYALILSYLLFAIGEKSNNKTYLLFPAFYYYCFLLIA